MYFLNAFVDRNDSFFQTSRISYLVMAHEFCELYLVGFTIEINENLKAIP